MLIPAALSHKSDFGLTIFVVIDPPLSQQKSQPLMDWLKEAATYSPTGKPQYHRRE